MKRHYKGPMRNSKVYTDHKGEYLIIDVDEDGNEYRVYITALKDLDEG